MSSRSIDLLFTLTLAVAGGAAAGAAALLLRGAHAPFALAATAAVAYALVASVARFRRHRAVAESQEPSPRSRLLERYARRVHELDDEADVSSTTEELFEVGLGFRRVELMIPTGHGDSWQLADGTPISESDAPAARLLPWLVDLGRPIERAELDALDLGALRGPLEAFVRSRAADLVLPLISRDEVVGLITAGERASDGELSSDERAFLRPLGEQLAAAIVYVRMKRAAVKKVEVAKDVELTAAVQDSFIPPGDPVELGAIRLAGAYLPASRCGGDWWSFRPLSGGRALVLVGDATGHGISAAMVTAAAKGCVDVALDRLGDAPDLGHILDALDAAIRRVGAGQYHMTLFATLIDPRAGEVHFANAGHNVPYVCRPRDGKRPELKVLPARGNPLGSGDGPVYERGTRPIAPGDVLVWYTDGITDGHDRDREVYGDRRMQRRLRELVAADGDVVAIRDGLLEASLAFQGRRQPDDDMTAVVASLGDADVT